MVLCLVRPERSGSAGLGPRGLCPGRGDGRLVPVSSRGVRLRSDLLVLGGQQSDWTWGHPSDLVLP